MSDFDSLTFIFDEPLVGLHEREKEKLIQVERLTGKTVYDILNEYMFPYVGIKCEPFIITPIMLFKFPICM